MQTIPFRRILAIVLGVASFVTTLWFVQWIWEDGPFWWQFGLAVVAELLLIGLKEQLYRQGGDMIAGWVGVIIDAIINTGGILPKSCRILSFPPIAVVGEALSSGVEPLKATASAGGGLHMDVQVITACTMYSIESVVIALIFGMMLSVFPNRLWRSK